MPEIGAARQIQTRPLPMPDTLFPPLKKKSAHQNNQHTRGITNIKHAFDIHYCTRILLNLPRKKIIGPSSPSLAFFLRKGYEIHPNF